MYKFLVIFILLSGTTALKAQVPQEEVDALIRLYESTGGPDWKNNQNWLSDSVATWYGVVIENNHIVELHLNNNHLNGALPENLDALEHLRHLNLNYNNIIGDVPTALLLNVDELEINNMTGFFPENTRPRYISYY